MPVEYDPIYQPELIAVTQQSTFSQMLRFAGCVNGTVAVTLDDVPPLSVNPQVFNPKANNLTRERKQAELKRKIRAQLNCGVGRAWRIYAGHGSTPGYMMACSWMRGKAKAFKMAYRVNHPFSTNQEWLPRFLEWLPRPGKLSHHMRNALVREVGASIRSCENGQDEYAPLCYSIWDRDGRITAFGTRDAGKEHAAQGHYVDATSARMIIAVPKDEWEKWGRRNHVVFSGYKQFQQAEGKLLLPWEAQDEVVTPITKKKLDGATLGYVISHYHNAKNKGYIELDEAPADVYTFGCEIEIIPARDRVHSREAAAAEIITDLGSTLDIEYDGSVSAGFEIVTGFGTFGALDKAVRELYARFLSSRHHVYRTAATTGLHIHVGRRAGIAKEKIVAMAQFEGMFPTLTTQLVGRVANRFCVRRGPHPAPELYDSARALRLFAALSSTRYSSFNATGWDDSEGTRFEWRSPKSTTSYAAWRSRLELLQVLLRWADNDLLRTKVPTVDDFLKRVMDSPRDDTVALRRALKTAAVTRTLSALGATVSVEYNGRREYAALNV